MSVGCIFLGSSFLLAYDSAFVQLAAKENSRTAPSEQELQKGILARKLAIRSESLERASFEGALEDRVEALLGGAREALRSKEYDRARAGAREVLILSPGNRSALEVLDGAVHPNSSGQAADLSFAIFKDEVPYLSAQERKRMIDFFMRRSDRFLKQKNYDQAVEELEFVFVLDPLHAEASRRIDAIKKRYIREKKREWRRRALETREEFQDRLAYSIGTVKQLMRQRNWTEAKVILNRMAFIDPEDREVHKLMEKIRRQEKRETEQERKNAA